MDNRNKSGSRSSGLGLGIAQAMILAATMGVAEPMGMNKSLPYQRPGLNQLFKRPTSGESTLKRVAKKRCRCECGKKTGHPKGFASKECLAKWKLENPGNGRYVNEQWSKMPATESFPGGRKEMCEEKVWLCNDLPFHVRTNTDHPTEFPLFQYVEINDPESPEIKNSWEVVEIFSSLIDAQRAAARFGLQVRRGEFNDQPVT